MWLSGDQKNAGRNRRAMNMLSNVEQSYIIVVPGKSNALSVEIMSLQNDSRPQ